MPAAAPLPPSSQDAILTLPNIITVVRFLGTPLFMWLVLARHEYGWGVFVLAMMGCTDWIDGFVARKLNQTSQLGRIMDPLADRVALVAVVITLVIAHILPLWLLLLLLIPDVVLLGATLYFFRGDANLKVTMLGKTRTAALLIGTPLLLLAEALDSEGTRIAAWIILVAAMVMHVIAFVLYFRALLAKHRELHHPANPAAGRP
ncbi:cardiolipin synthase [Arthrobacter silviterrae]|uniref:CDP-alcohol phosphatidyltransferase family protein n=1 Tax=Arthrobacter silviterrae TaxID=2026658 RepID=A0ABX0D575_9MICC|nr:MULTISPECIES: CDP-alcohol phosphatidyltransferase family protein [Arthrobacter]MCU6480290.1 CDP-alcohol phosphatidyltransferase family protein [Arthrobacter sp. A2-55]MDQ0279536.1 cardiolipin synthase [Arthrobacter silviterrae]NGN81987.1 CDP-alcohol phosphatidyltransferase family protein [Arthrobacter silviterrae]